MNDSLFQIGADGVDADRVSKEIRAEADRKTQQGLYAEAFGKRGAKIDLRKLAKDGTLIDSYVEALRSGIFVDINDFEIRETRTFLTGFFIGLKRLIWNALRFYTYRLWTQQNEVNGLLLSTVEALDAAHRDKIAELEARIRNLEKDQIPASKPGA